MGYIVYHIQHPREDRKYHATQKGAQISMTKLNNRLLREDRWIPTPGNIYEAPYAWAREDYFEQMFGGRKHG